MKVTYAKFILCYAGYIHDSGQIVLPTVMNI